jgi:hypothetical protein
MQNGIHKYVNRNISKYLDGSFFSANLSGVFLAHWLHAWNMSEETGSTCRT